MRAGINQISKCLEFTNTDNGFNSDFKDFHGAENCVHETNRFSNPETEKLCAN